MTWGPFPATQIQTACRTDGSLSGVPFRVPRLLRATGLLC
jgi:hypothetical protein